MKYAKRAAPPWPVALLRFMCQPITIPASFVYHSIEIPLDLYREIRHETKKVREHRWREQHRYGRLSLMRDSESDHTHIAPTTSKCLDSKKQATGPAPARAGELFNQLPLEVILCIFKFAGLSPKELG